MEMPYIETVKKQIYKPISSNVERCPDGKMSVQNILHEKQEVNKCIQYDFIFEKLKHMYTYMYIFKGLSLRTDLFTFSLDSNLSESTFLCLKLKYYIHTCYTCKEVQKMKCM